MMSALATARTAREYSNASDWERLGQTPTKHRPAPTTANDLSAESSHRGARGFKSLSSAQTRSLATGIAGVAGGLRPNGSGEDLRVRAADRTAPAELDLRRRVPAGWQQGDPDGIAGPDVAAAELAGHPDGTGQPSRVDGERPQVLREPPRRASEDGAAGQPPDVGDARRSRGDGHDVLGLVVAGGDPPGS